MNLMKKVNNAVRKAVRGSGPDRQLGESLFDYARRVGLFRAMILDNGLNFEPTTGTNITVTATSTNVIDLGVARDLGDGSEGPSMHITAEVLTAFTAAGAGTLVIAIQGAPETAVGSGVPGNYRTYGQTDALAIADLVLGNMISGLDLPRVNPDAGPNPRYLRLAYTVATGPFLTGKIYAGLTLTEDTNIKSGLYPAGFAVNN